MKLLKKWRGNGRETHLANRRDTGGGLDRFRNEMDQTFERVWRDFDRDPWAALTHLPEAISAMSDWPAVDMAEDDKAVTLRVDLPGLDPKDVEIEVTGGALTIRGIRQDEWSEKKRGIRRQERRYGRFSRTITLPEYVDAEQVEVKFDKGILTVIVPKVPGKGPRRVPISAG